MGNVVPKHQARLFQQQISPNAIKSIEIAEALRDALCRPERKEPRKGPGQGQELKRRNSVGLDHV